MTDNTVQAISERADNGIVASVWRSGNNLGMCFSKKGKTMTWGLEEVHNEAVLAQGQRGAGIEEGLS